MDDEILYNPNETFDCAMNLIILVLSCLFISYINSGIWLLIPFTSGMIGFGIALLLFFLLCIEQGVLTHFFDVLHGYGTVLIATISFFVMLYMGVEFKSSDFLKFFYCIVIMMMASHFSQSKELRKPLLVYIAFEVTVKMFVNIFYLISDPEFVRFSGGGYNNITVTGEGFQKLGGIYILYILMTILFVLLSNMSITRHKVVSIIYVSIVIALMLMSQMTLVLFATLILTVYIFFINPKHYAASIIIGIVGFIVIIFALKSIIPFLLDKQWFGNEINRRLRDVYNIFYSGQSFSKIINDYSVYKESFSLSSVKGRLYAYITSVKSLKSNFLLGYFSPDMSLHGGHSVLIDYICENGILTLVWYYSLVMYVRKLLKTTVVTNKKAIWCFSIAFVFLSIFNRFSVVDFYMQLFIILPYFYELLTAPPKTAKKLKGKVLRVNNLE